ncbi:uncharacterized protein TRAVEDRAFT_51880 [Trametes versicolor FP-101664 SS1]|uniref:uncharacterized protein n=1 Tax=Trametes versicolor (strain FP-101664) TaxID=717944 RepID=UPI0004622263|nr:uncharacterized protein TRAVEDRAFT_51880 [Trametes versicolor FP-101664 SS1]EIW54159.1 hypothetical protein TRAVEDRAFT_51880 [Trametes versicolor FP-101664 SS1]
MNYVEHLSQDAPTVMIEYYCIVASSALLWFDHMLTFPSEYARIWRRKFTGATLVFLLMRYAAFIERIFFVLEVLVWGANDEAYDHYHAPLKTYLAIAVATAANIASVAAAAFLIVLTWVKTFSIVSYSFRGGSRTPLATVLLQDGTLYILVILAFQLPPLLPTVVRVYSIQSLIWQWLTWLGAGSGIANWPSAWLYFGEVFVVIAHSRFMLSLRGLYFADGGAGESELTPHWSGINFHGISSRIVGNLGATLDLSPGSGLGAVHGVSPGAMWQDASDREFESGWADEVPEYCDDPFSAGLMNLRVGMPNVVERVAQERTAKPTAFWLYSSEDLGALRGDKGAQISFPALFAPMGANRKRRFPDRHLGSPLPSALM